MAGIATLFGWIDASLNPQPQPQQHFIGHENIIQIYDLLTVPPDTVDFRDVYIVTNLMVRACGCVCVYIYIYMCMCRPPLSDPSSHIQPQPKQESDMDRILGSNQPLTDQHFQYFLYQVRS